MKTTVFGGALFFFLTVSSALAAETQVKNQNPADCILDSLRNLAEAPAPQLPAVLSPKTPARIALPDQSLDYALEQKIVDHLFFSDTNILFSLKDPKGAGFFETQEPRWVVDTLVSTVKQRLGVNHLSTDPDSATLKQFTKLYGFPNKEAARNALRTLAEMEGDPEAASQGLARFRERILPLYRQLTELNALRANDKKISEQFPFGSFITTMQSPIWTIGLTQDPVALGVNIAAIVAFWGHQALPTKLDRQIAAVTKLMAAEARRGVHDRSADEKIEKTWRSWKNHLEATQQGPTSYSSATAENGDRLLRIAGVLRAFNELELPNGAKFNEILRGSEPLTDALRTQMLEGLERKRQQLEYLSAELENLVQDGVSTVEASARAGESTSPLHLQLQATQVLTAHQVQRNIFEIHERLDAIEFVLKEHELTGSVPKASDSVSWKERLQGTLSRLKGNPKASE